MAGLAGQLDPKPPAIGYAHAVFRAPRGSPGPLAPAGPRRGAVRPIFSILALFPGCQKPPKGPPRALQGTSRGCQKVPAHVVSIYGSHALLKGLPSPFQGPLKIQGCTFSALSKGLCWLTGLFKARFINFGSQETSLTSALSLHCPQ